LVDPCGEEAPQRRVREQAMDSVMLFCVSAVISTGVALGLTVVANMFG
jgi:hypothetical protein